MAQNEAYRTVLACVNKTSFSLFCITNTCFDTVQAFFSCMTPSLKASKYALKTWEFCGKGLRLRLVVLFRLPRFTCSVRADF